MRSHHLMFFSVATALTATALAAQTPAPAAAPQAVAVDDKAKVICKREQEIGSLARRKKVCHTKAEWEALAERTRDALGQGQMSGGTSGN